MEGEHFGAETGTDASGRGAYLELAAVWPLDERTCSAVRYTIGGGPIGPHPGDALR